MQLAQWGITIAGLLIMMGIAWFFWGPKKNGKRAEVGEDGYQEVKIIVKSGYTPDSIVVRVGKPVRLEFLRDEKVSCSEMVLLPDFQKSALLPYGKKITITLFPTHTGTFPFTCQMGMYRGQLIVKK